MRKLAILIVSLEVRGWMQNKHRPDRLLPTQMKNKLISSRGEERLKESYPAQPPPHLKTSPSDNTKTTPFFGLLKEPPTAQPSNKEIERNSLSGKRIKLKDYLHLTSLEKKNKERNKSLSRLSNQDINSAESSLKNTPHFESNHHSKVADAEQQSSLKNSSHPPSPQPPKPHRKVLPKPSIDLDLPSQLDGFSQMDDEQATVMMLQHQIEQRISREKKKLQDLQDFFTQKFKKKANKKDTYLFMFTIYNQLGMIKKVNKAIGQQVIEYGETDEEVKEAARHTGYFWAQKPVQLSSPVKRRKPRIEDSEVSKKNFVSNSKAVESSFVLWKVDT